MATSARKLNRIKSKSILPEFSFFEGTLFSAVTTYEVTVKALSKTNLFIRLITPIKVGVQSGTSKVSTIRLPTDHL